MKRRFSGPRVKLVHRVIRRRHTAGADLLLLTRCTSLLREEGRAVICRLILIDPPTLFVMLPTKRRARLLGYPLDLTLSN
jgi:hypothetical protein